MKQLCKLLMAFKFTVILSMPALADVRIHCDGSEHNLAIYQEMQKALFINRDYERAEEFYTDEFISHNRDGGKAGARTVKIDFLKNLWRVSKEKDPSRNLEDELILCIEDFVVVRTIASGKNHTAYDGNPPKGNPYRYTAIDIYRFENGKVVERWGNSDRLTKVKQIGLQLVRPEG